MRRALGLAGGAAKPRAPDRQEPAQRPGERFMPGHNGHKRRFVQDGEVPVTLVSGRRDGVGDTTSHRGPSVSGAPSRLEAAENALAHETATRHQAERALADAQAAVHDLQTKLGHAELARVEAVEGLRREQETVVSLRAELRACEERLRVAETDRPVRHRREPVAQPDRREYVQQDRREHVVQQAPVTAHLAEIDEMESLVTSRQPAAARRGRPPGKKPAGRSRLVRWWVKDEGKVD